MRSIVNKRPNDVMIVILNWRLCLQAIVEEFQPSGIDRGNSLSVKVWWDIEKQTFSMHA
jgi:hypothetical protein